MLVCWLLQCLEVEKIHKSRVCSLSHPPVGSVARPSFSGGVALVVRYAVYLPVRRHMLYHSLRVSDYWVVYYLSVDPFRVYHYLCRTLLGGPPCKKVHNLKNVLVNWTMFLKCKCKVFNTHTQTTYSSHCMHCSVESIYTIFIEASQQKKHVASI